MQTSKKSWDNGEVIAIKYLKNKDYIIIDSNFKFSQIWEIDLIAKKENIYVFVEVKYRKNSNYWTWEESISKNKKRKLLKTIHYYCMINNIDLENIRFDIISILKEEKSYKLMHYRNQSLEE